MSWMGLCNLLSSLHSWSSATSACPLIILQLRAHLLPCTGDILTPATPDGLENLRGLGALYGAGELQDKACDELSAAMQDCWKDDWAASPAPTVALLRLSHLVLRMLQPAVCDRPSMAHVAVELQRAFL